MAAFYPCLNHNLMKHPPPPDVSIWVSAAGAWCPAKKDGNCINRASADEAYYIFYTEFFEVNFTTPLYLTVQTLLFLTWKFCDFFPCISYTCGILFSDLPGLDTVFFSYGMFALVLSLSAAMRFWKKCLVFGSSEDLHVHLCTYACSHDLAPSSQNLGPSYLLGISDSPFLSW